MNKNTTKKKEKEVARAKKETLRQLIVFCESEKTLKDNPILIGGDFNLPMSIAEDILEDRANWNIPISEGHDPNGSRKEHIDYFLVYNKLHISKVTYESLTSEDPNRIFSKSDENQITDNGTVLVDHNKLLDHSPLLANLDLGSFP